jgi:glutamyl-tRNA reductase
MRLTLVGINHETAPVEIRERLAFSEAEAELVLSELKTDPRVEECLVVSTCNRTELLARHSPMSGEEAAGIPLWMIGRLKGWKNVSSLYEGLFYVFHNREAARHIFRVAAGLESMMLGEAQILGQMKDAYALAARARSNGFMLNKLMHSAFRAGKRARAETEIGIGAVSVSLAAAELAQKVFRDISKKRALVVGAGEMARLTAEHFIQKRIGSLAVMNRTEETGRALAESLGGRFTPLSALRAALVDADVVIAATGAREFVIDEKTVRAAMRERRNRALFIIDIGVPRNIDPAVKKIYNVFAYDIDDLKKIVDVNLGRRKREIPRVERIVEEELEDFVEWFRSLEVTPAIKELVEWAESVKRNEVEKSAKHFSPEQREQLDALAQGLVGKLLHPPISLLRESRHGGSDDAPYWVATIRKIFDLENNGRE